MPSSIKIMEKIEEGIERNKEIESILKIAEEAVKEGAEKLGSPGRNLILHLSKDTLQSYFDLIKNGKDEERKEIQASMFEGIETFAFYKEGEDPRIIIDIEDIDPDDKEILRGLILHEFTHILDEYKGIDDKIVKRLSKHTNLIWEQIPRLSELELDVSNKQWAKILLTIVANLILVVKDLTVDDFLVKNGFAKEVFIIKKDALHRKWKYIEKMREYRGEKILKQLKKENLEAFKDLFVSSIGILTLWLPLTRGAIRKSKDTELKKYAKIMRKLLWERVPIPRTIMKYNVKLMRTLQMSNLPPSEKVSKKLVREALKAFYYSIQVYIRRI